MTTERRITYSYSHGNADKMQASPSISTLHSDEHTPALELDSYIDILEGMEQGIIVWSVDGVCTFVNRRYFAITGSGEVDLFTGQTWNEHMRLLVRQGHYSLQQTEELWEKMTQRGVVTAERDTPGGKQISITVRPLKNTGFVVSVSDITNTKQHEEKLAKALTRAEQAEGDARCALAIQQTRQAEVDKLSEFTDWLHSCKSVTELYEIVNQAMQYIYPGSSGQLFIYSNSRDVLDGVCNWGDSSISNNIQAQDCWSLRRGRVFEFSDGMIKYDCNHVQPTKNNNSRHYYCLPLIAHGDTVGLLHLDMSMSTCDETDADLKAFNLAFATRCAEQISLAVANAQLRDELHEQSTRDPLTGLFNRRHFLERCRSESARAKKQSDVFGIAVFDADNFKAFNDHYGHDAGDAVLCDIADLAHRYFIEDDVVARIGGEEFAVLSLRRNASEFLACLEEFRLLITDMSVRYLNKPLPSVSVSIGYAMFPEHGSHVPELIRLADAAMYVSKDSGRNCIHEAISKKID